MYKPLSRGTSVLAALVFVGILGAVAWGVSALSPSAPRASQQASAGLALGNGTPNSATPAASPSTAASKDQISSSAPKDCNDAISRAKGKLQDPVVTTTDKTQAGTADACFGAVSKTGKPSTNAADYKCVGRSGTALIAGGQLSLTTRPDPEAGAGGTCKVNMCNGDLQHCSAAKQYQGVKASALTGLTPLGTDSGSYNPLTLNQTPQVGGANGSGQLGGAFSGPQPGDYQGEDPATIDKALSNAEKINQIAQNNDEISQLNKQLDQCAGAGVDGCDPAVVQQRVADLQKQNEDLKGQIQNLTPATPAGCKSSSCVDNEQGTYTGPKVTPGCTGPNCNTTLGPGNTPGNSNNNSQNPGSGILGSIMQGLLGGLAKGLGAGIAASNAPACSSDPNAYAQQQQQYNMQMQQYQLQLQQYQLQQQYARLNGAYYAAPTPPPPPQQCQMTSSSNTCPTGPAQPSPSGCTNGSWKPVTTALSNGYQCTNSWQCVPTGGTTPTAQISCQPLVADVGMSIAISYSCGNATGSAGSGFDTQNALSGSTTTVVTAPPSGAIGINYGVNCTNQGLSAQAQCTVQVGKASIVLVANPKVVQPGGNSTIGWITSGMSSCVVSSPDLPDFTSQNAGNTSVNGMATTSALSKPVHILLHCTTAGGGTKDATTTVSVFGVPDTTTNDGSVTAYSSVDGQNVSRGSTATIGWSATSAPSGSKMSLWLYDVRLGGTTALIQNELAASSTYTWHIPNANDACDASSNQVCGTDLQPGRQYGIEADLYTGSTSAPTYGASGYTPSPFTITQ